MLSGFTLETREADDWVALYINGEKVRQGNTPGHSLDWWDVLDALEIHYTRVEVENIDYDDPEASFPETLPCS